jgi:hypothetical protein
MGLLSLIIKLIKIQLIVFYGTFFLLYGFRFSSKLLLHERRNKTKQMAVLSKFLPVSTKQTTYEIQFRIILRNKKEIGILFQIISMWKANDITYR